MMQTLRTIGIAALIATSGFAFAASTYTYAQTQGSDRRQSGRAAKQACKAGNEKSRAECRQLKRGVKHGTHPPAPATAGK